MLRAWRYRAKAGTFQIVEKPSPTGPRATRFHAMLGDEDLGNYATPEVALAELVGGHTDFPSSGVRTDHCGLPDELSEWTASL